ncbi:MAG TPA: AIR synthase-related protein, partial [Flavihumibacter sp.]|nr:AIR synthase-related protein [Flavihumibacter sp.]
NKRLIPGEVLEAVISGTQEFFDQMKGYGVHIHYLGGETADVGDVVRSMAVNGTMTARWPKNRLVTNDKIQPGDVIVGFASSGQTHYENSYNSGIGSNGLTSARHDALSKFYAEKYPESYDTGLDNEVVYIGQHRMTDLAEVPGFGQIAVGKLVLSATRTYAPLLKVILDEYFEEVHGLVHASGGGQTKCLKYLPGPMTLVKDNLLATPVVFNILQQASKSDWREMYQVFNMGQRLELFCAPASADKMIAVAKSLGMEAQIIGRVEAGDKKKLILTAEDGTIVEY